MVNGYLHRVEALEERLKIRECDALCLKCYLRKYRADRDGTEWSGCDGRPVNAGNIRDLSDEELEAASVTLKEILSNQENCELPSPT